MELLDGLYRGRQLETGPDSLDRQTDLGRKVAAPLGARTRGVSPVQARAGQDGSGPVRFLFTAPNALFLFYFCRVDTVQTSSTYNLVDSMLQSCRVCKGPCN